MIATEVALTAGHEKLTSFLWSHKDTKTGTLGNATDRGYLEYFKVSDKLSQYPIDVMKNMGFTSDQPSPGANS